MDGTASYLIDAAGNIELGNRSDPNLADSAALDAVTLLGHIEWLVRLGHVRVRLRPALTSPAAYCRLRAWLTSTQAPRVLLSYFVNGAWDYEFLRHPELTIRRVDRLMTQYGGGNLTTVRRQARSLTKPGNTRGAVAAIEYWKEKRQSFDPQQCLRVLDPILGSRWILLDSSHEHQHRLMRFGENNSPYVAKWLSQNIGSLLTSAPDTAYSESCVAAYRSVEQAGEPGLEDVDAFAVWPRFGHVRSRYHRLMLPFKSNSSSLLLVATTIDETIDLIP